MATTTLPAKTFKLGRIQAAVWKNAGERGTYYSVTIERRYHDGQWNSSHSFSRTDLPLVAKVADHAHTWIYEQAGSDSENAESVATEGDGGGHDAVVSAVMQEAYRLQQSRLACPGCGETPFVG